MFRVTSVTKWDKIFYFEYNFRSKYFRQKEIAFAVLLYL